MTKLFRNLFLTLKLWPQVYILKHKTTACMSSYLIAMSYYKRLLTSFYAVETLPILIHISRKKVTHFFKFWYHKANKYPFHRCDQTNLSRKQKIIPSVEKKLRFASVLVQLVLNVCESFRKSTNKPVLLKSHTKR